MWKLDCPWCGKDMGGPSNLGSRPSEDAPKWFTLSERIPALVCPYCSNPVKASQRSQRWLLLGVPCVLAWFADLLIFPASYVPTWAIWALGVLGVIGVVLARATMHLEKDFSSTYRNSGSSSPKVRAPANGILQTFKVRKREDFSVSRFKAGILGFGIVNIICSLIAVWSLGTPPFTQILYPILSIPFSIFWAYMDTKYIWGIEYVRSFAILYYTVPALAIQIGVFHYVLRLFGS